MYRDSRPKTNKQTTIRKQQQLQQHIIKAETSQYLSGQ